MAMRGQEPCPAFSFPIRFCVLLGVGKTLSLALFGFIVVFFFVNFFDLIAYFVFFIDLLLNILSVGAY